MRLRLAGTGEDAPAGIRRSVAELLPAAEPFRQRAPGVPVVLRDAVLDRDDRIASGELGVEVAHAVPVGLASLEAVRALGEELARRRIECDRDVLAMACALGGLE